MDFRSTSRRSFVLASASVGLFAPGILRADRALPSESGGFMRTASCENGAVMTSNISSRISVPEDFMSASACRLSGSTVEGPFFICVDAESGKNIAAARPGYPLTLALRVVDGNCSPIPGAVVDVWCCDTYGNYSGHAVDPNSGSAPRGRREPDLASRFLRGVLSADADGIAEFDMIYPGFYRGRAIHVHYKVHIGNKAFLTSQALFPEEVNEKVMATTAPYNEPRLAKRVLNVGDPAFLGDSGMFKVVKRGTTPLAIINLSVAT